MLPESQINIRIVKDAACYLRIVIDKSGTRHCRHSGTVVSIVFKRLPTAGRRRHRKLVWCWNQKSMFLPRLCGASSDWQSAGLLWLGGDTSLTMAVLRKREVGGIAQCSRFPCDTLSLWVHLCVHLLCFSFFGFFGFWLCCPLTVTPHWSHDDGGGVDGGFHWSKLWYQQPFWPPPPPPPYRKHLRSSSSRDGAWLWLRFLRLSWFQWERFWKFKIVC